MSLIRFITIFISSEDDADYKNFHIIDDKLIYKTNSIIAFKYKDIIFIKDDAFNPIIKLLIRYKVKRKIIHLPPEHLEDVLNSNQLQNYLLKFHRFK